ncbi:MAG: hypothetical protein ACE5KJ_02675 [Candidatus Zixiibacteriota bacterium]
MSEKSGFDTEELSVKIPEKKVRRVTAIFLASILFFVPLSLQACQKVEVSQNACCCCCVNSSDSSHPNDAKQHECPCQMGESQQEESPPAIIVSHHDSKPEPFLVASEVEVTTKDYRPRLTSSSSLPFSLTSKDPPLYLLHSSFLI